METNLSNKKIAIVCDWLTNMGGAEKVILNLHKMFPLAPIYTTLYDKDRVEGFEKATIYTSFLQRIPFSQKKHPLFLNSMPLAIESFNLDDYDIVISSSHAVAKGIITNPDTVHFCYCHTPMRYAWEPWELENRLKAFPKFMHSNIKNKIHKLRIWDRLSADRVDHFIVNSNYIGERVKKYYRRDSEVIHPPIDTNSFSIAQSEGIGSPFPVGLEPTAERQGGEAVRGSEEPSGSRRGVKGSESSGEVGSPPVKEESEEVGGDNYFLMVGRLITYKKFDLVIEAFNELNKPLVIVGTGPDESKLKKLAKKNIIFKGRVSDEELKELYAGCQALVFPQLEDFGITPVECMASGRPVIAFAQGGSKDTVVEGQTGVIFQEQTVDSLKEALAKFDGMSWNSQDIKEHAEEFSESVFRDKLLNFIKAKIK